MKKLTNKLNMAIVGLMASVAASPAFAATGTDSGLNNAICQLIDQFGSVFKTLRTLAFIGAAFYIAGWAWEWISKGEVKKDDVQNKGVGLLVGFFVLFALGAIISAFMSMGKVGGILDCVQTAFQ